MKNAKNKYFCDEYYEKLVARVAEEIGLDNNINIMPIAKGKAKEVVKVRKANDDVELFLEKDNIVFIDLYIQAFEEVRKDVAVQEMWVRMALSQVSYNLDKDKVEIGGPTVTLPLVFMQKYGEEAVKKAELAELIIQQLQDRGKNKA